MKKHEELMEEEIKDRQLRCDHEWESFSRKETYPACPGGVSHIDYICKKCLYKKESIISQSW